MYVLQHAAASFRLVSGRDSLSVNGCWRDLLIKQSNGISPIWLLQLWPFPSFKSVPINGIIYNHLQLVKGFNCRRRTRTYRKLGFLWSLHCHVTIDHYRGQAFWVSPWIPLDCHHRGKLNFGTTPEISYRWLMLVIYIQLHLMIFNTSWYIRMIPNVND